MSIYENVAQGPDIPLRVNYRDHWMGFRVFLDGEHRADCREADAVEGWVKVLPNGCRLNENGELIEILLFGHVRIEAISPLLPKE